MPKRQQIKKFTSTEVQGADSWVVLSFMTIAEMRANMDKRTEAKAKAEAAGDSFAVQDVAFGIAVDLLKTHVLEWNWVDDDGNPLAQMTDDPTVVEQLTDPEVGFLAKCIQGSEEEAKNSPSKSS